VNVSPAIGTVYKALVTIMTKPRINRLQFSQTPAVKNAVTVAKKSVLAATLAVSCVATASVAGVQALPDVTIDAAEETGDREKAEQPAQSSSKTDVVAALHNANQLIQAGDVNAAIKLLSNAIPQQPNADADTEQIAKLHLARGLAYV